MVVLAGMVPDCIAHGVRTGTELSGVLPIFIHFKITYPFIFAHCVFGEPNRLNSIGISYRRVAVLNKT